MGETESRDAMTRRRALALGGGLAGGLLAGAGPLRLAAAEAAPAVATKRGRLPVKQIEDIVGAEGTVSDGVLTIDIERDDIGNVRGPLGVIFTPSFEVDGTLTFQPLGNDRAFLNGDLPLLP